jgi:hypothetical protein
MNDYEVTRRGKILLLESYGKGRYANEELMGDRSAMCYKNFINQMT